MYLNITRIIWVEFQINTTSRIFSRESSNAIYIIYGEIRITQNIEIFSIFLIIDNINLMYRLSFTNTYSYC